MQEASGPRPAGAPLTAEDLNHYQTLALRHSCDFFDNAEAAELVAVVSALIQRRAAAGFTAADFEQWLQHDMVEDVRLGLINLRRGLGADSGPFVQTPKESGARSGNSMAIILLLIIVLTVALLALLLLPQR